MPTGFKANTFVPNLPLALRRIRREAKSWKRPVVGLFAEGPDAAFQVLISTVISLRTKDAVTEEAGRRLFALAPDVRRMAALSAADVEKAIYPAGFYRTKARSILEISRILLTRHGGRVPETLEELLALPGVGLKTANLTLALAHRRDAICVDTHVHRICNRWGLVRTRTPEETEAALRRVLPKKYWMSFNELLVAYGQNLCVPVSPLCSRCPLSAFCPRKGVIRSR